ncbi:hypothetical protein Acsp04_06160 [Actinomadura sp. NBRC 104425]|nr:hypothetical protein Acsp04_06160 [Actinomadura sp. NBRC 104425]
MVGGGVVHRDHFEVRRVRHQDRVQALAQVALHQVNGDDDTERDGRARARSGLSVSDVSWGVCHGSEKVSSWGRPVEGLYGL